MANGCDEWSTLEVGGEVQCASTAATGPQAVARSEAVIVAWCATSSAVILGSQALTASDRAETFPQRGAVDVSAVGEQEPRRSRGGLRRRPRRPARPGTACHRACRRDRSCQRSAERSPSCLSLASSGRVTRRCQRRSRRRALLDAAEGRPKADVLVAAALVRVGAVGRAGSPPRRRGRRTMPASAASSGRYGSGRRRGRAACERRRFHRPARPPRAAASATRTSVWPYGRRTSAFRINNAAVIGSPAQSRVHHGSVERGAVGFGAVGEERGHHRPRLPVGVWVPHVPRGLLEATREPGGHSAVERRAAAGVAAVRVGAFADLANDLDVVVRRYGLVQRQVRLRAVVAQTEVEMQVAERVQEHADAQCHYTRANTHDAEHDPADHTPNGPALAVLPTRVTRRGAPLPCRHRHNRSASRPDVTVASRFSDLPGSRHPSGPNAAIRSISTAPERREGGMPRPALCQLTGLGRVDRRGADVEPSGMSPASVVSTSWRWWKVS